MAAVSSVNLIIHKGTNFEETFVLKDENDSNLDLTTSTVTSRIRKHPTATQFNSFTTLIIGGNVKISMASTITATLKSGRNHFDVVLTDSIGGFISKILEGNILVYDTVSL
jgi:hypothetical protein